MSLSKWSSVYKSDTITVSGDRATRTGAGDNSRSIISEAGSPGDAAWKVKIVQGPVIVGIATTALDRERWLGATAASWGYDGSDGQKCHNGTWSAYFGQTFKCVHYPCCWRWPTNQCAIPPLRLSTHSTPHPFLDQNWRCRGSDGWDAWGAALAAVQSQPPHRSSRVCPH